MNDRQLIRFATSFRQGILGKRSSRAMCFAVSAPLQGLLSLHGIDSELVEGTVSDLAEGDFCEWNHFWLRLADGRVLDATADQFLSYLPPVYLGEPLGIHQEAAAS